MTRVVVLFAILVFVGISSATHLRYGSTTVTKSLSNPLVVTITSTIATRRSYYGAPNVGGTISESRMDFGDGGSTYPNFVLNNVDLPGDVLFATATVSHTYPRPGTYKITLSNCCRISNLNNLRDLDFRHDVQFSITAAEIADHSLINNPPVANSLPVIFVPLGVRNYQYAVTAQDNEGDSLTFSLATSVQMTGSTTYSNAQPTGLTISPTGLVTLTTLLAQGFWTTQQRINDGHGNEISVDYLINVQPIQSYCNNSCAAPCSSATPCSAGPCGPVAPSCLQASPRIVTASLSDTSASARTNLPSPVDGAVLNFDAGSVYYINFVADDSNLVTSPGTSVTINAASLPVGVTAETQTACNAASNCQYVGTYSTPQLRRYRFAPSANQLGTSGVLCIGAISGGSGLSYSQHCVTLAVNPAVCGNGRVEFGEECEGGDCCNAASCTYSSVATTCRAAAGPCDVAETCTGSSTTCPADTIASSATTCRASSGPCDVAETCTGSSVTCPADTFAASTVTCRASAGDCDVAETCTGSSAACPTDAFSTDVCRASAGDCDVAESCTGSSATCPTDSFATGICRAAAGDCDVAETCTGSSAACPADAFLTSATECRAAAGDCDVAETCSGSASSCPADSFVASTVTCRASAGECDVAETCTGSSAACPTDAFLTSECRASAGDCDLAESCSGSSASCPADSFSTSICRVAAGPCDISDRCDGVTASCPTDAMKDSTVVCRAAVDTCDVAETCSGSSVSCPADNLSQSASCFCARAADPNADPNVPVSTYHCNASGNGFYQCMSGLWSALSANQPCAAGTMCQCPQGVNCGCAGNPCTLPGDIPNC